jgi:hypothetical protein
MLRKLLPLVLIAALGACRSAGRPAPNLAAKPGWGRQADPDHVETTVRALPASAKPVLPPVRQGKPGWGR